MRIQDLFERDIGRPINGVVKADQLDDSSVWQELDEFVVTKELDGHIRRFFAAYLEALERGNDPDIAGKIGIWVSGFFGSGKSHFIKVLSYLLRNQTHTLGKQKKDAVDFFESKVKDAMLYADIKRAVATHADVILFNIDSKASNRDGRDAILHVFLKVLNEMRGYSGDHPHIAHLERHLESKGKLDAFKDNYKKATGSNWVDERDAYHFHRDEVVKTVCATLGLSTQSAEKWIDGAEESFSLTVESFCKWVKEYLDSKGPLHRIVFLVDEVGQFVGSDSQLMLNLQTITENLGTTCKGRAWVVVTSQEDIDSVLGEMKRSKANDFSKIQGRFKTRLSLSSANADEVIHSRLLSKVPAAAKELEALYKTKGDILKHHLTFTNCGMSFKPYKDCDDFVKNYPFAPYQFQLVQKIFEAIRKVGATGLHLAKGERSMLDAFQSAAKTISAMEPGALVPLYLFYPSIESFLDTSVKRTIDQARDNSSLEVPFDTQLLQVLFLIRYVEEMKGNIDNLVTLCLDQIDGDRLELRKRIEAGLARLEKETLISRNGENYFFLTNEERDVNREIKAVDLSSGDEARLLGELIFDDSLKGMNKHRYSVNKVDFPYNRVCDLTPFGNQKDGALKVVVVSPMCDGYDVYSKEKCQLESSMDGGIVLLKLGNETNLGREVRTYLQIEKYTKTKNDGTLPLSTKTILNACASDNRQRRERLGRTLSEMMTEADSYIAGQAYKSKANSPEGVFVESFEYLIQNTFDKMKFLQRLCDDPLKEAQAVLRSNDLGKETLLAQTGENNPLALEDLRKYVENCAATSHQIVLSDMIDKRYTLRPFGWPDNEVLLLIARLAVLGEIGLMMDGALLPLDRIYDAFSASAKRKKIVVVKRHLSDPKSLQSARMLGKDLFGETGPDGEDTLYVFLQSKLKDWQSSLKGFKPLADTGSYPGKKEIAEGLSLAERLLADKDPFKFIERFNTLKNDLKDFADSYVNLAHFYNQQKPAWEKLRNAHQRFQLNRLELESHAKAGPALQRMQVVLDAASPYGLIKEVEGLVSTVNGVNESLIGDQRLPAQAEIAKRITTLKDDLAKAQSDDALNAMCLSPLEKLLLRLTNEESIAHISQMKVEAIKAYDAASAQIDEFVRKKKEVVKATESGTPIAVPVVKSKCVIRASELVKTPYLETQADVDGFLDVLGQKLKAAISKNERIEIR